METRFKGLIAIPSTNPGGQQAPLGAHFGHCDLYTLVQIEDNAVKKIEVIPNVPHQQGGCMAPVQYLAEKGVKILIAGGMGLPAPSAKRSTPCWPASCPSSGRSTPAAVAAA
ncbi:MAG: NifB/NifX family molybdenum-iron cluster-binding protein [Desulfosarcinaceae bacterium]